ncbi:Fe-S oxidoreductase [Desulfobaculum xiamenense]|uniref:Fe-S oxidoreductase n=1 Tax=Desulfobaculum xiamenense TaxID=995050 RepID=A0A846QCM5_9BACT|nr:pyridine nucleotide-disulfide oxidoreductase/dicluster-binding protein [Desulfobaculum xiamenense]NJB66466.1 Fe-S oxidoreductase [Desulfobaculum xiamenense]
MDQAELHRIEARCIQEEPPRCRAACPLHVDAREFCTLLAAGRIDAAWAVLCRTLPLPGILARICDAPCRAACLRSQCGGGIDMAALERFCATSARKTPPLHPLPSRGKNAAIIGCGLPALAAAWDLARKGFAVRIHCRAMADIPASAYLEDCPTDIVERELERLRTLGVTFVEDAEPAPKLVEALLAATDAVFVDPRACPAEALGIPAPDPTTLETTRPGLFAAPSPAPGTSPAALAALGRKAALSIERLMQGASLTAGREREAPFASRLYTNISDVAPLAPVPVPPTGYDDTSAREEARRCLRCECMECVRHCAYLEHFKGYPKTYARQIYNNASIVMGTRQANTLINSCMLCGLCEELCPEHFPMVALCLDARRDMVQRGKMPPSAHEFALRDMTFANGESCAVAKLQPGTTTNRWVFFPGCQLPASAPDAVERTYAHLRETLPGGTALLLRCCGAPAHWSGRQDLFAASVDALRADWEALGTPTLVTACPTCAQMLREHLPEANTASLWAVLGQYGMPPSPAVPAGPLCLHDPCTTRHDDALRAQVRTLCAALGITPTEPSLSGRLTECCGFGGLLADANAPLAATVAARRAEKLDGTGLTYCAMCRDLLAQAGKPCLHLLDLLFPADDTPPTPRPAPGISKRRENRVRLRERLMDTLWREANAPRPEHESLAIAYTPAAKEIMEKRRILESDVARTLFAAKRDGHILARAGSPRRLATHRPSTVTYWVEFECDAAGGYVVHNAWSHRMRVSGVES